MDFNYTILEKRDFYAIDCSNFWDSSVDEGLIRLGAHSLGKGQITVPKDIIIPILKYLSDARL